MRSPASGSELEERGAHPSGGAVHEHRLPALRLRRAVKQLVGRHVWKDEAHDLCRVPVLGHLDRIFLRHADALRVGAPHGQCAHAFALAQPLAAWAERLDDAHELVPGRERRLRSAEVRAGAQLRIGERNAGRQHPHPHLARARPWNLVLHHLHDLGATIVINDDALHVHTPLPLVTEIEQTGGQRRGTQPAASCVPGRGDQAFHATTLVERRTICVNHSV